MPLPTRTIRWVSSNRTMIGGMAPGLLDEASRDWLRDLGGDGTRREEAVARLHDLLLKAARFEVARRRQALPQLRRAGAGRARAGSSSRRGARGPASPRRLQGREPLHDMGVQVRVAGGRSEGPPVDVAASRAPARARDLVAVRAPRRRRPPLRPSASSCSKRSRRASHVADAAPAGGARRARPQRRADRRARRAARQQQECALQVSARCAAQPPRPARGARPDRRMVMDELRPEPDAAAAPRPVRAGARLRRVLRRARPLRRARARGARRGRDRAWTPRPSRRLPRLRRGAREPARALLELGLNCPDPNDESEVTMNATRYLIVGGGMTGDMPPPRASASTTPKARSGSSAPSSTPRTRGRRSRRGSGSAATRRRSGARRPMRGSTCVSAAGSSRSTSTRGARQTTPARTYAWEKLLLATGGAAARAPGAEGVVYYRTLDDYRGSCARTKEGSPVVVIGGGFIGSELAAALTAAGRTRDDGLPGGGRRLAGPARRALAASSRSTTASTASTCCAGELVVSAAGALGRRPGSGRTLEADVVVAGLGIEPEHRAGRGGRARGRERNRRRRARPRGGTRTSSPQATSRASRSPRSARRLRVEHEDHAKTHGRAVGANMAGANLPYDHLPFFYSDMFDLGYEAVGERRLAARDGRGVEGAEPQGRRRLRRRRPPAARRSCSGTSGTRSTRHAS